MTMSNVVNGMSKDRESTISHWLCGLITCECPGRHSADPETAVCWKMAKKLITVNQLTRIDLAIAIAPELTATKACKQ